MMICQIMIKKNKTWSFILDNNFTCLSISREIEENYAFNLNLLRKVDIELTDLFDININIMKNKFKETLDVIEKVKDELSFNDIEQYSKNLFNLNINNELDLDDNIFIPNKKSLEISNSNIDLCDTSILFGKKMETIEFVRSKPLLIQNIIKALNKLTDSVTRDDNINTLLKLLMKVKRSATNAGNNIGGESILQLDGFQKSPTMENEMLYDAHDEEEEIVQNATLQILFKGVIKKLYDIPIYIFRFRDILDNEEGYKADNQNTNNNNNNNNVSNLVQTSTILSKKSNSNYPSLKTSGLNINTFGGSTQTSNQKYFKNISSMFSTQSSIASIDSRINNLAILDQASKFGKKSKQYKKAVEQILKKKNKN